VNCIPEIVDAEDGEDSLPSCSAVEALNGQEPFINQTLASSALAMLARRGDALKLQRSFEKN
jgi:hypothetical protein